MDMLFHKGNFGESGAAAGFQSQSGSEVFFANPRAELGGRHGAFRLCSRRYPNMKWNRAGGYNCFRTVPFRKSHPCDPSSRVVSGFLERKRRMRDTGCGRTFEAGLSIRLSVQLVPSMKSDTLGRARWKCQASRVCYVAPCSGAPRSRRQGSLRSCRERSSYHVRAGL